MIFHVPTKPIRETLEISINATKRRVGRMGDMESGHLLEESLLFSRSIGVMSEELSEECLPAINRRKTL